MYEFFSAEQGPWVYRNSALLEPSPGLQFTSFKSADEDEHSTSQGGSEIFAHKAGVNVLAIDKYYGRYLVSGGADPSIRLWDLDDRGAELQYLHEPKAWVDKTRHELAHTHALTSISIYPFDPTPSTILTTSRDNTLKLSAVGNGVITPAHTFNLHATPYCHSLSSHPASTLLIAAGTSERTIRLLDLRSGLATHTLLGHDSAVLSVDWAPHRPYILTSASTDNRAIIFDIRKAGTSSAIGSLDMDNTAGVSAQARITGSIVKHHAFSRRGRAHNGALTGVRWTSTGSHLITAGQDSRLRVWDATTGANTLVHFGPRLRNSASSHLAERIPLILPSNLVESGHEIVLWPNFNDQEDRGEILMFEIRDGAFIKTLKVSGLMSTSRHHRVGKSSALTAGRINALAWRGNGGSGEGLELFSAHGDGTIRTWVSRVPEGETDTEDNNEPDTRKRKRDVLEEIYQGLTGSSVSFT
ncbi:WD repeat protein [Talaromyces stipitatus ATCC 10500]|uniref:WD repeat protein n=1 Tax=Talaromyces stipitatus (strain ATCC 10500 / CBS 375.48 / QM 6759 / NRRL 1006) TaxID=441959 RepID=B8MEA9_TALSN|nr:WD repeat protein [Talaromyces stipitatus ATCC 10500]EED16536.1 WD repeat protein [Talaromyces stipitatus ATCC 10500]